MSWVEQELPSVHLGDARLNRRLVALVEALADHPTASVPMALPDWAAVKAAYRFWDNPRVEAAAIRQAHQRSTRARALTAGWVLLVQDTTDLDFTTHPAMAGRGMLYHPDGRGLFVHSTLGVSLDGLPLGLVAQQTWARDPATRGLGKQRNARPTPEKDSQKWLTALAASHQGLPGAVTTITVADREADCYDLWVAPRRPNAHLLIRAKHDRTLVGASAHLWAHLQTHPVADTQVVTLPRRHTGATTVPARPATLQLRYASVTLGVPQLKTGAPVPVQAVLVEEIAGQNGEEPLQWLLLTTLPIPSPEVAWLLVEWYTYRWLIERYHAVLKSGCGVEEVQLATTERLERALATYSIVAWRLLTLRYLVDQAPEMECEGVLTPAEWQAAYVTAHPTAPLPTRPPTLREALWCLGRLGGFLGRTGDGMPGITALWRGWARLQDILLGMQAYQRLQSRLVGNA